MKALLRGTQKTTMPGIIGNFNKVVDTDYYEYTALAAYSYKINLCNFEICCTVNQNHISSFD